ncbi:Nicotinamide-nucleotide amidohydrolase PncC [Georgfuchsia toluolica]|uniref:Nicotinamide-nucleotide amidohydrolase PncC n=1 Tax=Georgfuchsia toluolica TaxID=424218 RepID=A0A916N9T0_9PROT|nr:nicotinamide-nucleotide amidohydrolase family protein [Georgfuchsia toluolica]CAG4884380.1 Nicotinamide-nucleotide amidohydrolase PncC [Georgfuchsia toluolica]
MQLDALSRQVGKTLQKANLTLATAESCTGGWVAEVVTRTAGSSGWFECGFVTYSNAAKTRLLNVAAATLTAHGAVSEATAAAMVLGVLAHSTAGVALSVTGIAGPDGGSVDKPVGTVCFGWCRRNGTPQTATRHFAGDRTSVRRLAVLFALEGLLRQLEQV